MQRRLQSGVASAKIERAETIRKAFSELPRQIVVSVDERNFPQETLDALPGRFCVNDSGGEQKRYDEQSADQDFLPARFPPSASFSRKLSLHGNLRNARRDDRLDREEMNRSTLVKRSYAALELLR